MKKYLPVSEADAAEKLFSEESTAEERNICINYLGADRDSVLVFEEGDGASASLVGAIAEAALPDTSCVFYAADGGTYMLLARDGQDREDVSALCEALYADISSETAHDVFFGYTFADPAAAMPAARKKAHRAAALCRKCVTDGHSADYDAVFGYELIASLTGGEADESLIEEKRDLIAGLDPELCKTVKVFLDCDLNISLASRRLYLHRNSMIYRLDKVEALTGLDPRKFNDAFCMRLLISAEDRNERE